VRPTVIVTAPGAVALAEIVIDVDETVEIVAPAGIPVPEIGIPAYKKAVTVALMLEIVALALAVVPVKVVVSWLVAVERLSKPRRN
jgi:hypothetical protein